MLRYFIFLCVTGTILALEVKFPNDFKFGVASAAYQVEGGWNESGKGVNVWDNLVHEHSNWIEDNSTGDTTCNSYNKIDEDVQNLAWLGVNHYRFSLSWSRLLPTGVSNQINQDGVRYYNELINKLVANNITPMVTLYHWDLPIAMQELGGWSNSILIDYFAEYAEVAFSLFGDRVKTWITINEPQEICHGLTGDRIHSVENYINLDLNAAEYLCHHVLLTTHATVYQLYNTKFRQQQEGKIGIALSAYWYEPKTNTTEDIEAANRALEFTIGWWANPIFCKRGKCRYQIRNQLKSVICNKQNNNNKNKTSQNKENNILCLPEYLAEFLEKQLRHIQGTSDFLGINHYTTLLASNLENNTYNNQSANKLYVKNNVVISVNPSWPNTSATWIKVAPFGFRKILNWIREKYDNPEVIITENGYPDKGELNDTSRINYHQEYLNVLLEAIYLDRCKVTGYTAWSFMDNFEWFRGYTLKFGLFQVNFNDNNRTRKAKNSAMFYKNFIQKRV